MFSTVLLASVLDFLLKKDVVDKGGGISVAPTRLEHSAFGKNLKALSFFSPEKRTEECLNL